MDGEAGKRQQTVGDLAVGKRLWRALDGGRGDGLRVATAQPCGTRLEAPVELRQRRCGRLGPPPRQQHRQRHALDPVVAAATAAALCAAAAAAAALGLALGLIFAVLRCHGRSHAIGVCLWAFAVAAAALLVAVVGCGGGLGIGVSGGGAVGEEVDEGGKVPVAEDGVVLGVERLLAEGDEGLLLRRRRRAHGARPLAAHAHRADAAQRRGARGRGRRRDGRGVDERRRAADRAQEALDALVQVLQRRPRHVEAPRAVRARLARVRAVVDERALGAHREARAVPARRAPQHVRRAALAPRRTAHPAHRQHAPLAPPRPARHHSVAAGLSALSLCLSDCLLPLFSLFLP